MHLFTTVFDATIMLFSKTLIKCKTKRDDVKIANIYTIIVLMFTFDSKSITTTSKKIQLINLIIMGCDLYCKFVPYRPGREIRLQRS